MLVFFIGVFALMKSFSTYNINAFRQSRHKQADCFHVKLSFNVAISINNTGWDGVLFEARVQGEVIGDGETMEMCTGWTSRKCWQGN
jgi:putative Mn2+ efflux pump MntP